jgi:hypothetical protein
MLNTEGMTPDGIERKATCQNLFRKLLFLTGTKVNCCAAALQC